MFTDIEITKENMLSRLVTVKEMLEEVRNNIYQEQSQGVNVVWTVGLYNKAIAKYNSTTDLLQNDELDDALENVYFLEGCMRSLFSIHLAHELQKDTELDDVFGDDVHPVLCQYHKILIEGQPPKYNHYQQQRWWYDY